MIAGSLILAIINFIRATVKYIEAKTKRKGNPIQKALFCMIQCCLTCLHWCADKLRWGPGKRASCARRCSQMPQQERADMVLDLRRRVHSFGIWLVQAHLE